MLPENWPVLEAFLTVQTQMVYSGMSGTLTGFDYTRVEAGLRMASIEITPELFEGIRIIETEILTIRNSDG